MSDFFYFRKEDRKVIVTLAIIAIFCVGVMLVVNAFKSKDEPKKASALAENIMPNSNNKEEGVSNSEDEEESIAESKASKLFAFDPNTIDSTTLVSFGIKAWKVKNFIHYRKAGKVFHSVDDMLDTYGWTEEDIKPLRPYIHIGKAYQKESYPTVADSRKEHDEQCRVYEYEKRSSLKYLFHEISLEIYIHERIVAVLHYQINTNPEKSKRYKSCHIDPGLYQNLFHQREAAYDTAYQIRPVV